MSQDGSPVDAPVRVLHVLAGAGVGGTERQLLLLLPRLAGLIDTRLVIIRGGRLAADFARAVPTELIPKHGKVDPVFLARLVAAVRRQAPDVLQTWGTTANVWGAAAARLAGVPHLVVTEGALDEWKGRLHRRVDARVYRWADRVVTNSAAVRSFLAVGNGGTRFEVIPNGVVVPAEVGRGERVAGQVVYLGRLHPVKGADLLVEAMPSVLRAVPNARCRLAGPAEQPVEREFAGSLRARVAELGLTERIEFVGPVSDPTGLLGAAAVVVVPSRSEGSPNVVYEAMAQAAPLVATAVGGTAELLAHGETGLLVRPGDPQELAAAIVACLTDPRAATARAQSARAMAAAKFDIDVVAGLWAALYRDVTAVPSASIPGAGP
ncbi:MAG TPA: glycosyltransferase [Mycobacteriales bacterium]|nr:glycosyltransferase [Mycobacteriales bacterium]